LGSDQFPAPAAQSWRAVALALSGGIDTLEPIKVWSIAIGALVGLLLTMLPHWFPRLGRWLPSATGIGLSWTFHWYYGMLFFIGGVLGWAMERRDPQQAEIYNFPIAAGVMAGGSLMGVLLIFWENGPAALQQLLGTP
ncbi:MAG: OPT/YSL family transporter, partial [Proteobacteria bacterium]|nr:OPT/YSL family transporter [Pseudomonadota bacterium]